MQPASREPNKGNGRRSTQASNDRRTTSRDCWGCGSLGHRREVCPTNPLPIQGAVRPGMWRRLPLATKSQHWLLWSACWKTSTGLGELHASAREEESGVA